MKMIGPALIFLLPIVMTTDSQFAGRADMEARAARQELEAAQSKSFYLVVDAWQRKAFLKMRGVELRSFGLQAVELGTLQLGLKVETGWADSVCDFKRTIPLEPREMKPTTMTEPDDRLLAPEEEHPLPGYFDVECVSELSIRFVPQGRRGLWAWFSDRMAPPGSSSPARLRIQMNEENYRDLYQVIPQEGKILFVVPDNIKLQ